MQCLQNLVDYKSTINLINKLLLTERSYNTFYSMVLKKWIGFRFTSNVNTLLSRYLPAFKHISNVFLNFKKKNTNLNA